MPLQNRVTPEGEIIATSHRGLLMGNRGGAFHAADRTIGTAPLGHPAVDRLRARLQGPASGGHAAQPLHRAVLPGRGHRARRRPPALLRMPPRRRRPVRRAVDQDARRRRARTRPGHGRSAACRTRGSRPQEGHISRAARGTSRAVHSSATRRTASMRGLILLSAIIFWGGSPPVTRPSSPRLAITEEVEVLTPASIVAVLSAGYRPMLHPSAAALLG